MADPFEQFTSGVPNIGSVAGARMFDRNPMDSRMRFGQMQNKQAAQSAILETQNRIEQFRQARRASQQAPSVMGALAQLNPVDDPDYDQKVMGVLSRAPDAMLDKTVANFLEVQGGIFDRVSQERDYTRRSDDWMKRGEEQNRLMIERQKAGYQEAARAERAKRFTALPPSQRQQASAWINAGEDVEAALSTAEGDAISHKEVNELREQGYTDGEIFEAVNPDGSLDPGKRAGLVGAKAREKESKKSPTEDKSEIFRELEFLDKAMERRINSAPPDQTPDLSDLEAVRAQLEERLGWRKPGAAPVPTAPPSAPAPPAKRDVKSAIDSTFGF